MMPLAGYLELGTDPTSLAAAALVADTHDHAATATCVTIFDLATKMEEGGYFVEMHVMRHAARWLQAETEAHRKVRDELVERSGFGETLLKFMRERRAAAVASREASKPLFGLCQRYMSLALRRAGADEGERLLARGDELGALMSGAILAFVKAIREPSNG